MEFDAPPLRKPGEHRQLPWPTIVKDAVPRLEGYQLYQDDHREQLLNREGAWTGVMCWGFGVVVLLLVVMPTAAIPKLLGPWPMPVTGAGYGPMVAIFALLSMVVAVGGGLWIWVAMGRDYEAEERPPPPHR